MRLLENDKYKKELDFFSKKNIEWNKLRNKTIMISGATGLIGSYLIDVIMYKNINQKLHCNIIALGRNEEKAKIHFEEYWELKEFTFLEFDLNEANKLKYSGDVDYIIHLASNTHPKAYSLDPIGTITTNVIGTRDLLEFGYEKKITRFVFTSSVEIYGESRGDIDKFDENYLGYINCNTLRAGYPESKRCGETLCQAYISQKGMDIVIPRLCRIYGPTMLMTDTKALSQFIKNALSGDDIILKSEGNQYYSYLYVADAVIALLTIMLSGNCGDAYNIADEKSNIHVKDLAKVIAGTNKKQVVFELPDEIEKKGFSTATKALLDNKKIVKLGWEAEYNISQGISNTISILKTTI